MQLRTMTLFCLALGLAAATIGQPPAPAPADAKKTPAKADLKATPASPAKKDAKKDDKKKKEDAPGIIEGMEIARGTGFLGLQIVNGVFKLTVYDAKKKPVAADFTRVAIRWNPSNQKNPERALLTPGSGIGVFTSDKIIKPPHAFKLFIALIKGEGDAAPVENLTVDFRA